MRHKACLLATVSSLALLGVAGWAVPAKAADLAPKPVLKAPPPVVEPPFSWTGFYIGVQGGAGWLSHKQTTFENNGACTDTGLFSVTSTCSFHETGGVFGGFAGYNWQSGNVIYGVEADGSWVGLKHVESFRFNADPTVRGEVEWLATVRGRLGVAFSPTMIYVTGGVAFGGLNSGWTTTFATPPVGAFDKKTKTGWVAGGGIEHAFSKLWSVRAEVLYHDLGRDSASATFSGVTYATSFRHTVTTARAGLALRW